MSDRGFSSILRLTDLDDFIAPSQECIKPMDKPIERRDAQTGSVSKIRVELDDDGVYSQTNQTRDRAAEPLPKVSITLSDCLACSGCVTSAESVLISQQGPDELIKLLKRNKLSKDSLNGESPTLCIVSIGVQAVLSLAEKFHLAPQEAAERVAGLFVDLGADLVTTATIGENLSLLESKNEFLRHLDENQNGKSSPVLSGICPGWICYAEKLHGHSLPYISRVKSPQQIMGSLIKLLYTRDINRTPDEIYHISLMSCFDRKLESSREDFYLSKFHVKEVDSVITPVEIEQVLEILEKKLVDFEPHKLKNLFPAPGDNGTSSFLLMSHYGSGSGGYAEFMYRSIAKSRYNKTVDDVRWTQGRNPDIWEAVLSGENGETFRFCIATGFRNIQTLVRKLKTKSLASQLPHYIEIMACPTGCMNGGAQSRPAASDQSPTARDLSFKLLEEYRSLPLASEEEDTSVRRILQTLGSPDSAEYQAVFYTQFHAIEKLANVGIKW